MGALDILFIIIIKIVLFNTSFYFIFKNYFVVVVVVLTLTFIFR